MTEEEYLIHIGEYNGICLNCGEIRFGDTEPDAENYPCNECEEDCVMGIENALVCEHITIAE